MFDPERALTEILRRLKTLETTLANREDTYYTVEEAEQIYGLSRSTLYKWKDVQVKIRGSLRISRAAIEKSIVKV